jgi:putative ABC transport system substrate-binding protein
MLSTGPAGTPDDAPHSQFREGMRAAGFTDVTTSAPSGTSETDYVIVYRSAVFNTDLLIQFARELVAWGAEVIVASSTGATQAARLVTSDVPIVMVASHDPIESGIVTQLARPGGNVTGQCFTGAALIPRQLDYLQQIVPVRRLLYLSPSLISPGAGYPSVTDAFERSMRAAASAQGIDIVTPPKITSVIEVEPALASLTGERIDAVHVIESPTWFVPGTNRPINQIVDFALHRRLPSIGGWRNLAAAGVLASYGDVRQGHTLLRGAAGYVAKILRGARPGDLAIEPPPAFELVINATTASAIHLEIPKRVLNQANDVIK